MEETERRVVLRVNSDLGDIKNDVENPMISDIENTKETFLPARQFNIFDDIFVVIGEFGRYQRLLYFMFSVTYIMTAMQLLGWVFIGAKPSVRCILPSDEKGTEQPEYKSVPQNSTSSCSYVWNGNNVSTCDLGYVYDTSNVKYSAVIEWDLVCENEGTLWLYLCLLNLKPKIIFCDAIYEFLLSL